MRGRVDNWFFGDHQYVLSMDSPGLARPCLIRASVRHALISTHAIFSQINLTAVLPKIRSPIHFHLNHE